MRKPLRLRSIFLGAGLVVILGIVGFLLYARFSSSDPFEYPDGLVELEHSRSFTMLTVNVGNSDPRCILNYLKLCRKDVEDRIAKNIQILSPDLITVQETLPPWMCEDRPSTDPGHVCAGPQDSPQIRRLLGTDYTIVCEIRNGYECIGLHMRAGEIQGCKRGDLCTTERIDVHPEGCRPNVTVMAATIEMLDTSLDVINAHPERRTAACRQSSMEQIFERTEFGEPLIQAEQALILGDLNMDPWRESDVSTMYWTQWVGETLVEPYGYHSGPAERIPPYPTIRYPGFSRTYDHVASDFLEGTTVVLGESPNTFRIDGGYGMDHRAVFGRLYLALE